MRKIHALTLLLGVVMSSPYFAVEVLCEARRTGASWSRLIFMSIATSALSPPVRQQLNSQRLTGALELGDEREAVASGADGEARDVCETGGGEVGRLLPVCVVRGVEAIELGVLGHQDRAVGQPRVVFAAGQRFDERVGAMRADIDEFDKPRVGRGLVDEAEDLSFARDALERAPDVGAQGALFDGDGPVFGERDELERVRLLRVCAENKERERAFV